MPTKGITISVTAETNSGGRRHMEDYLAVKLCPNEQLRQIPELREQAYIGVFDGHGGKEAAKFTRERLWDLIQMQPKFLSTDVETVRESIQEAFVALHEEMQPLRETWKRNKMGDLSTAGTTVSTVIFRQDNIFVANVGDSTAVLAVRNPDASLPGEHPLVAQVLTKDHKPEDPEETKLVESLGGRVMVSRKGVPRVVWERQRRNSSPDDEQQVDLIPFLSVSRSLGDFWSLNPRTNQFVVSPTPDVNVYPLDPTNQKFVVVASDGLWNVMSPTDVVRLIWDYEHDNQKCHQPRDVVRAVINECLRRWKAKNLLADNIAVLIAFLSEEDNCQPSLSGLSSSSAPMLEGEVTTNGEVSVNGGSHVTTTCPSPSPETGIASEPRDNPGSPSSINTSTVIRHVSTTKSGSTLYYKETLPEGVTIEYQTKIKLRHRRKEKHRPKEGKSVNPTDSPRSPRRPEGGSAKRQRKDDSISHEEEMPAKRTKLDPDSGCEAEEEPCPCGSGVKATRDTGSDSSSGVFSDEAGVLESLSNPAPDMSTTCVLPEQVEVAE